MYFKIEIKASKAAIRLKARGHHLGGTITFIETTTQQNAYDV